MRELGHENWHILHSTQNIFIIQRGGLASFFLVAQSLIVSAIIVPRPFLTIALFTLSLILPARGPVFPLLKIIN